MAYDLSVYNSLRTPEERHEIAVKAGKASAQARRVYKTQRELIRQILATQTDDPELLEQLKEMGFNGTFACAAVLAAARKAQNGDIEALRYLRDTVGEKPTDQYNLGISGKPIKSLDLSKLTDAELEALADEAEVDKG